MNKGKQSMKLYKIMFLMRNKEKLEFRCNSEQLGYIHNSLYRKEIIQISNRLGEYHINSLDVSYTIEQELNIKGCD